jgi:pyruvate/2-oxoglutarate dehydrogenase complex dihydrolipoamide acyltransferase (E2) component
MAVWSPSTRSSCARVTGFLEQRLFEEGADVAAGDLLFVIEKGPYQAVVAQPCPPASGSSGPAPHSRRRRSRARPRWSWGLVIASGAGALSRRAVGTPVFGGMLFASFFGIFLIPMLYVVFQWLRERSSRGPAPATPGEQPGLADAPSAAGGAVE